MSYLRNASGAAPAREVKPSSAVGEGEVGVKRADLTAVLKNVPPGAWVALARQENKVVGTGKTVEEALASAKKRWAISFLSRPFRARLLVVILPSSSGGVGGRAGGGVELGLGPPPGCPPPVSGRRGR